MADDANNSPPTPEPQGDPVLAAAVADTPAEPTQDPGLQTASDPAAQSLADALRVSFLILKIVMVLLVVAYLFTGYFTVDQQHAAVKMRFGKLVGEPGERVLGSGPHFGLPVPFESHIIVRTAPQVLELTEAFWYELSEDEQKMTIEDLAESGRTGPLNPVRDGYLITGDANIVHGRFRVTFQVEEKNVELYVQNVGTEEMQHKLVKSAVSQAIIAEAAKVQADDFIAGRSRLEGAENAAQNVLDALETGLTINNIEVVAPSMPIAVRQAYNAVNSAESEAATAIDQAERDRARTLATAAGPAAAPQGDREGPLTQLIDRYESLPETDEQRAELKEQIDRAFRSLKLETEQGTFDIGGDAARIIDEAQSFRTNIVEGISREAQRLKQLDASYRNNPELFKQRVWQTARREIFDSDSDYEVFYVLDGGRLYLNINRDPKIADEQEQKRSERIGE